MSVTYRSIPTCAIDPPLEGDLRHNRADKPHRKGMVWTGLMRLYGSLVEDVSMDVKHFYTLKKFLFNPKFY
jgi:hypothetical protein